MIKQDWHEKAVALSEKGLSGRKIASKLGMGKTQVNDYLKWRRDNSLEKSGDKAVKYLFFDLESSLMEGYFFKIWQENIPCSRIKKHSHLLTAAWAFNDGEVDSIRVDPLDVKTSNDLEVVKKVIEQINKADVLVTFNGKKFDLKLLNLRALFWGLPPITVKKHIDLFEQAKKVFKFPSNSMQNISMYLGQEGKIATGGTLLWERCANWEDKDECLKALIEMETYNKGDIAATRDLFYLFQGWGKGTPNIGMITNALQDTKDLRCTHCGSKNVAEINEKGYTAMSSFSLYRCGNSTCRGVSRVNATGKMLVSLN